MYVCIVEKIIKTALFDAKQMKNYEHKFPLPVADLCRIYTPQRKHILVYVDILKVLSLVMK